MTTTQWVRITPDGVEVNGEPLTTIACGVELLTEVYRARVNDYPKFFKMDELAKLGFLASELLLQAERQVEGHVLETNGNDDKQGLATDGNDYSDNRAVILFGRNGSLACDRRYQATIVNVNDFFPSPSIFVYTLPNIVTGEIAIRNHYNGETAFYLTDERDDDLMRAVVEASLLDAATRSVLCGWVDYESETCFEAYMTIYNKA